MKAKKLASIALMVATGLAVGAYLAWQLIGYAMAAFAKGGVC